MSGHLQAHLIFHYLELHYGLRLINQILNILYFYVTFINFTCTKHHHLLPISLNTFESES